MSHEETFFDSEAARNIRNTKVDVDGIREQMLAVLAPNEAVAVLDDMSSQIAKAFGVPRHML